MWWYMCLRSWEVGITCAVLSLTVGANIVRNSSDKRTPSATRSVSKYGVNPLAFVPQSSMRSGSVASTGVTHFSTGLPYDASGPSLSSAFHVRSPRNLMPNTDDPLRDFSPAIVESFVGELRLQHVVLLTSESVVSCRRIARALLMSPTFVSVSCDAVRAGRAQLVVLVTGDSVDHVTDEEGHDNANSLQRPESSLQKKIRNAMGDRKQARNLDENAKSGDLHGKCGKSQQMFENVTIHLKKTALAMPPGSKIIQLTRRSRVPPFPVPNVHLYQVTIQRYGAVIREAWTFPGDQRPVVELRGYWTPSEGLWLEPRQYEGPRNFQGRVLRVAILPDPPYLTFDNSSGQPVLGGYLPGVLDMLAAGLNFIPHIVTPPDGKFGGELPNGSWSGMVGMLQEGNAELMLASLFMSERRRRVVDYLSPLEWTHYGFVIRDRTSRLGEDEVNWTAYTEPFSPAFWAAAGLWTGMVAATPPESEFKAINNAATGFENGPLTEPLWTVLGVLVQQGVFTVPEPPSQRILLKSLWVFSIVLFASYTSNIVSLLASTRYIMPFETLEQLAALTDWKIITNPLNRDFCQLRRVRELNKTGRLHPIKAFLPDALELLLTNDNSAIFTGYSNIDHVLRRNCSFVWSSIRVLPSAGYLTAQRHLPYRDALSTRLTHLSEAGLLRQLWERTLLQPTAVGCRRLSQFNTMTLRQTAPALALLGVGLMAAVLVALVEWCWGRRRAHRKGRGMRDKRLRKRFKM